MKNLLSIDLEDWYHFIGDPGAPAYEHWDNLESRVEIAVERLLDILGERRATFFVLGYMADRHPALVKRLSALGHEIACHGDRHDFVFQLGPERFREDLRRSKKKLENLTDLPCRGYRAPGFSIRKQDSWALEIIREEGFVYDSSVFPAVRTSGGIAGFYPYPRALETASGELMELPVSTSRILGVTTAFCGGGFFRFVPWGYMRRNIERINRGGHPVVVYLHPRDIDPGQPRMKLKPVNRFMYYYGLKGAAEKFRRLVESFDWISLGEYVDKANSEAN